MKMFQKSIDCGDEKPIYQSRVRCCVKMCRASKIQFPNRRFYNFPTSAKARERWIAACFGDRKPRVKTLFICSSHFTERDLTSKRFLVRDPDLVPSLYLFCANPYNENKVS